MATTYTVDIYRLQIARMYQVGGEGYRWLDRVRLAMHTACVNAAPSRTGTLKRAHRSSIRGTNQYKARAEVENIAQHAEWVHQGTDWIEGVMRVPRQRGPLRGAALPKRAVFYTNGKGKNATGVEGQTANPWMDEACTRIARRPGTISIG